MQPKSQQTPFRILAALLESPWAPSSASSHYPAAKQLLSNAPGM